MWDVLTNKPITDYLGLSLPKSDAGGDRDFVAFDRAGTRVVVTRGSQGVDVDLAVPTGEGRGQFRVWNTATGEPVTPEITLPRAVNSASFSPDGARLVTANGVRWGRGMITTWDLDTAQVVTDIETRSAAIQAWHSGDGKRLLTAHGGWASHESGYAQVWDVASGTRISGEMSHTRSLLFACLSKDDRKAATASWDNTARVWDANSGIPISPPLQHSDRVLTVAFSPDGSLVATVSKDGTAVVWDAVTGEPITPQLSLDAAFLVSHQYQKLDFSPHGNAVVTAGSDGKARIWKISQSTPLLASLDDLLIVFGLQPGEHGTPYLPADLNAAWQQLSLVYRGSLDKDVGQSGHRNHASFEELLRRGPKPPRVKIPTKRSDWLPRL